MQYLKCASALKTGALKSCIKLLVAAALVIAPVASLGSAQVIAYPAIPGTPLSSNYSVRVNGQSVPVELYETPSGPVSFARFAFTGTATLVVTLSQTITTYTLSPKSYNVPATVSGKTLSLTLATPRRLVLRNVNGVNEELFLLADGPEVNPPRLGQNGVTNALSVAGVDNSNTIDDSAAINAAITNISSNGGGTLYFPAGVYNIQSSIDMKSNVTVYLAAGAVFQVPSYYNCCFENQGVVNFFDVSNAKLSGRGVINGNAINIPNGNQYFHMIMTENAANIEIDDVLLFDQGITGMRLVNAKNSAIRNVKIIVNTANTVSDGIDFDSSQYITVDNAFIYSSDDNTSQGGGTGIRHTIKDQYYLTVENSVLYNSRTGAAFKIGTTDPQNSINNITYQNIDIVDCVQMAAFYPTQGANLDTISLSNVHVDTLADRLMEFIIEIPTWETWDGRLGYIHNVSLNNVSSRGVGVRDSLFQAYSATQNIQAITFTNYSVAGQMITSAGASHIDMSSFVSDVAFNVSAPPQPSPASPIANGTYIMTNQYNGLVSDDPGFSSTSGAQLIQWSANGGQNQKWIFTVQQSGYYTIKNAFSGLYLTDQGNMAQQLFRNGSASQLWTLASAGTNLYTVTNKASGRRLDIPALSSAHGAGLVTGSPDGGLDQVWSVK
jgi:polygalacturonase